MQVLAVTFILAATFSLQLLSVAAPSAPETKPLQTQTRDFLLYATQHDGEQQPKLVVRADYLAYPSEPSYQNFLPAGVPKTPEAVLALRNKIKLAPEKLLDAFKTLYTPQEQIPAENGDDKFTDFFLRERADAAKHDDLTLRHRYDVGDVSYLFGSSKAFFPVQVLPVLRRDNRAYAANYQLARELGSANNVIRLMENEASENVAPRDWPLPYRLQLRTKTGAASDEHPLWIFFDGKPLDLPVEQAAKNPDDAILNFTQQVVQTYRTGSDQEWLDLWTAADARDFWQKAIKENPSYYQREREKFADKGGTYYVYFVMDLGKYASVFIATRQFLTLDLALTRLDFRQVADGYRLASDWTLTDGEPSFSRDLGYVLGTKELESEIRRLVRPIAALEAAPSPL